MEKDKKYWLAIDSCLEIGAVGLRRLFRFFRKMEEAWSANSKEWQKAGLSQNQRLALAQTRQRVNPETEVKKLNHLKIGFITFREDNFPRQLFNIPDPPAIIYIRGQIQKKDELALAVVGTRRMSTYGRRVTEDIVSKVAEAGVTIISGLARGVDTCAHQAALATQGRTIAVLGSGLDDNSIYPFENRGLAQKIIKGRGALLSEFHPGTSPLRHHFPMRNRIISALSLATLVTECPIPSGALITAKSALEQGRDVFAVPGDIYRYNCLGTNNLIKLGAKPITQAEEVFEEMGVEAKSNKKILAESKEEEIIIETIKDKTLNIESIAKLTKLNIEKVNSTLTMMEIKGKVRNIGTNLFVLKK